LCHILEQFLLVISSFCSPDFQVEVEPIPAKDAEILADYEEQQIVVGSKWHPFLVIDHGWKIHENP
jgi:hypothetical protein